MGQRACVKLGLEYWETGGLDRLMPRLWTCPQGCTRAQASSLLSSFHGGNAEIMQYVSTCVKMEGDKVQSLKDEKPWKKECSFCLNPKGRHGDRNWAQTQTRETDLFSTVKFIPTKELIHMRSRLNMLHVSSLMHLSTLSETPMIVSIMVGTLPHGILSCRIRQKFVQLKTWFYKVVTSLKVINIRHILKP